MTVLEGVTQNVNRNSLMFEEIRRHIRVGASECDLQRYMGEIFSRQNQKECRFEGDIVSGERTASVEGTATDRLLKQGDVIILDIQIFSGGYAADTTRTFFLGEPTEEMKVMYKRLCEAMEQTERVLKHGTLACDVYKKMADCLCSYGHNTSFPHHAGHALSKLPFEQPQLVAECNIPLEKGMIIALEPGLYNDDFGMRIENNYLITDDGCEKIGSFTTDINYFIIKE